ncbi:MAG: dihydrolipoamide acetyltransferase family protein, partial [Anaerolineae bacterium]
MASEVVMPKMGYDMEEGKVVQWIKQEGDPVESGEVIAEIETGKVNIEIEAFDSGVLRRIVAREGETVPVGGTIAWITAPDEELPGAPADGRESPVAETPAPEKAQEPATPSPEPAVPEEEFAPVAGVKASPLARRIAEERGVDITQVGGTGPGGRITRADVEAYVEAPPAAPTRPAVPAPVPEPRPEVAAQREPVSQLWKTLGRRMVESKANAPHFYVTMSIDMGKAMELRDQINEYTDKTERVKISVNDLVVKAASLVLKQFPRMNASLAGEELVLHPQVNMGIAVAIEAGLLTLVIPNTDDKSLLQIAQETRDKVARAREGKLRAEDFQTAGTFTISNLGMYGVDEFVAIINPPEAAIMAVGAVQPTPAVRNGIVTVAQVMRATVSGDHRIVDGAYVAQFLVELKRV